MTRILAFFLSIWFQVESNSGNRAFKNRWDVFRFFRSWIHGYATFFLMWFVRIFHGLFLQDIKVADLRKTSLGAAKIFIEFRITSLLRVEILFEKNIAVKSYCLQTNIFCKILQSPSPVFVKAIYYWIIRLGQRNQGACKILYEFLSLIRKLPCPYLPEGFLKISDGISFHISIFLTS